MRLVSAFYSESHPFDTFWFINDIISTKDPKDLKAGDILVVWGGQDIHPSLYGKAASSKSQAYEEPTHRDKVEWALIQQAIKLGIPTIGVCRGAQMLCAAAGGYLIQHVTGHGGQHEVVTNEGHTYFTNSLHHQMMVPGNTNHEVLAQIPTNKLRSSVYLDVDVRVDHDVEPEFIYFNDIKGFAVQWHPEMMPAHMPATNHILRVMEEKLEITRHPAGVY